MSEQQLNQNDFWAQVANLRPGLRDGVEILSMDYRGERWYLMSDQTSGRYMRFNAVAYEFLGRMDGDLTVEEIVEIANGEHADEDALSPEDVLQVLAQLHGAEVLRGGLPLAAKDLLQRYQQHRRSRQRTLSNPLALRIPLFDPDRLLAHMLPAFRWVYSNIGLALWASVITAALLLVITHTDDLAAAIGAKTLSAHEVLMFWLLYPVIKALHEIGHGLAVKVWGGEVHETGISLLVFMPVPYVDASAAWSFRDKRRRIVVGAAGIMVELLIAAIACIVWVLVEPGLVRDLALNVMLIGGFSTVFFNGNPLLKFDGYYVLEDVVEIPSLATRSKKYYLYLIQRYLLGLDDVRRPVSARGEAVWFAVYGLLSPLYRLFLMVTIAFYLAAEFMVVGVILATWAIFAQLIRPLLRSLYFIVTSPRLAARRIRGLAVVGSTLVLTFGALSLPAPLVTRAQGVVWPDAEARVISPVGGFVDEVLVRSGDQVSAGEILLQLDEPELDARREVLRARLEELRSEQMARREKSRVKAAMVADDIAAAEAELAELDRQAEARIVRSQVAGTYFATEPHEMTGRWIEHGDVLGYVSRPHRQKIRAVIDQDRIGLLRNRDTEVEVMFVDSLGESVPARILREVPAGSEELPSSALGAAAGGEIAVDLSDEQGRKAAEKVFQVELILPPGSRARGIGGRAYVRFEHGSESLLRQWGRGVRQLVLSRLQT